MPDAPEHRIAALLRAYAKKRREDAARAPLDLHPATRRLLQDEVARAFRPPAEQRRAWWPALWPRLAWAAAVLVVVGVAARMLAPRHPPAQQMARSEADQRGRVVEADSDRPAKDAPAVALRDESETLRRQPTAQAGEKAAAEQRFFRGDQLERNGKEVAQADRRLLERTPRLLADDERRKQLASATPEGGRARVEGIVTLADRGDLPPGDAKTRLPAPITPAAPPPAGPRSLALSETRSRGGGATTQQSDTFGVGGGGFGGAGDGRAPGGGIASASRPAPAERGVAVQTEAALSAANGVATVTAANSAPTGVLAFNYSVPTSGTLTNVALGRVAAYSLNATGPGTASAPGNLPAATSLDATSFYSKADSSKLAETYELRAAGADKQLKGPPGRDGTPVLSAGKGVAQPTLNERLNVTTTPAAELAKAKAEAAPAAPAATTPLPALQPAEPAELRIPRSGFRVLQPETQNAERGRGEAPAGARHRFSRVDQTVRLGVVLNAPAPPAVLTDFEVEQSGDRIRLIDADGSVYDGRITAGLDERERRQSEFARRTLPTPAPPPDAEKKQSVSDALATEELADAAARGLSFRASGTNRSLRQLVEITGVLTVGNEGQAAPAPTITAAPVLTRPAGKPAQSTAAPPVWRLQGKARIGGTNELPLDAVRR